MGTLLYKSLRDAYDNLEQDLDSTIGEYAIEYVAEIEESSENYAQLVVSVQDKLVYNIQYLLRFRLYPNGVVKINRYEDVWDEESKENIWMMLFFSASKKI